MRIFELLPIAVLALAGCATPPMTANDIGYARAATTYDTYLQDRHECLMETGRPMSAFMNDQPGSARSAVIVSRAKVSACMVKRGYAESPNGFKPPLGGDAMCAKC
jgi:hypothetical protein